MFRLPTSSEMMSTSVSRVSGRECWWISRSMWNDAPYTVAYVGGVSRSSGNEVDMNMHYCLTGFSAAVDSCIEPDD